MPWTSPASGNPAGQTQVGRNSTSQGLAYWRGRWGPGGGVAGAERNTCPVPLVVGALPLELAWRARSRGCGPRPRLSRQRPWLAAGASWPASERRNSRLLSRPAGRARPRALEPELPGMNGPTPRHEPPEQAERSRWLEEERPSHQYGGRFKERSRREVERQTNNNLKDKELRML